ncbi:MAG: hypothetical protein B7Z01_08070 [Brevundimonas subvibrioides]|uniref:VOC domain-containing protein n=1 Tax=Brevundimonas subvibrioides TaxID=74313 RepID=A0A258FM82_9CAUL|nr:MAG: hypothetical protein B7Z01_08070 [Brevundimonas subvibrioides]
MIRALMLATALAISACASTAVAEPAPDRVPADQRVPLDFRRTTLVVRDMEASLAFYRAIGLVPIYDNIIRTPRDAPTDAAAERSLRLVFLRANDDYIGIIGLMEYAKPEREPRPARAEDDRILHPGDIYDGASVIRVNFSSVYDPDGHYIELNQVLSDLPVGE